MLLKGLRMRGGQVSRKITRASVATVFLEAIVKAGCWIVKAELANKDIHLGLSGLQKLEIGSRIKGLQLSFLTRVNNLWTIEEFLPYDRDIFTVPLESLHVQPD
jgi:hypothetical protein